MNTRFIKPAFHQTNSKFAQEGGQKISLESKLTDVSDLLDPSLLVGPDVLVDVLDALLLLLLDAAGSLAAALLLFEDHF